MKHIRLFLTAIATTLLMSSFVFAQETAVTVTETGNVGIGTTSPGAKLEVNGTVAANAFASTSPLIFEAPLGTERMRILDTNGNVGIGTTSPGATLHLNRGGNSFLIGNSSTKGLLLRDTGGAVDIESFGVPLFINNGGQNTLLNPQGGGNVGIGTTSPSFPLEMGSGAHVTVGGVWTDASSREYKENIRDLTLEEALAALEALEPVQYNYKVDQEDEHLGFIAEDVPDLVASKDRKGLSPMDIVAVLTKVVQHQQQQIAELKARLDAQR